MQQQVDRLGNIGAMVTISLPNAPAIQLATGHADRERRRPLSPDLCFQIGSQTKTFTVLALLILVDQQKLRLADPVTQYLDVDVDPRITLEMLAMNTSGLGEYADLVFNQSFPGMALLSPEILIRMALLKGQGWEPGQHFDYSNIGFVMLGRVIEVVSGTALPDFIRQHIAQVVGLSDLVFGATERQPHEQMARGYLISKGSAGTVDMSTVSLSWAFATGDMVTSMSTLVAFARALLKKDGGLPMGLDQLTRRIARAPQRPTNSALSLGGEYAYGLERCSWAGRPVWGHRGGTAGYNSGTWIDPELGVVVTSCITCVRDFTEPEALASARYPGAQLFTLALACAYDLVDA